MALYSKESWKKYAFPLINKKFSRAPICMTDFYQILWSTYRIFEPNIEYSNHCKNGAIQQGALGKYVFPLINKKFSRAPTCTIDSYQILCVKYRIFVPIIEYSNHCKNGAIQQGVIYDS